MRRVIVALALGIALALILATPAFAGNLPALQSPTAGDLAAGTGIADIAAIVQKLITALFGVATLVAVCVVVWQGFKLMSGNPSAAQDAKTAIIQTLVGLGVILFSWSIVGVVVNTLGKL